MRIVAEIGSNHEGRLDWALQLVEAAAGSGATDVKVQVFTAEALYRDPENHPRTAKYALPLEWLPELRAAAHQQNMGFGASVFSRSLMQACRGQLDFIKVAAYDITYYILIQAAASLCVPLTLSTAMANIAEIHWALLHIPPEIDLTLLHGVAAYPCRLEDMNLSAIRTLKKTWPRTQVGLSDHSLGYTAAVMSVVYGATMIEKHFRLADGPRYSLDWEHSASPQEFSEMVKQVRCAQAACGDGEKEGPIEAEKPLYLTARRSDAEPYRR